jgi:hypothetical protein
MNGEKSVCLALIHNQDTERNAYIQPLLNDLRIRLLENFSAIEIQVASQPEIKPHTLRMALLRDAMYYALDRQWCRYRNIRPQKLPSQARSFLSKSREKYSRAQNGWRRSSTIETIVTDKHVRAWSTFLETRSDFLICFEDDAIFKGDSVPRLTDLLNKLFEESADMPIYVDLAGGCELEQLRIGKLETGHEASFRHYNKPVTNTACVYLMSRSLVKTFYEMITSRPWLRLIGADWMMNKLFMQMANDQIACRCMHADPTIFHHGTTTGKYVSSIRPT